MDQLAKIVMDDKKYADFCVKYCGYDLHIENEEVHPIYHLQVVGAEGERQDLFVSSQELNAGKWHKKIGFLIQLRSAKKLNDLVIRTIQEQKNTCLPEKRVYHKLGWKKWEGEWRFLFTNGAIPSSGFSKQEISSIQGYEFGAELPPKEKVTELETQFAKLLVKGDSISLVFLHSLMSILREPLRETGFDLGITLWIYGTPSSGKTEILRYLTNIRGVSRSEIDKRIFSPSEGIPLVMSGLAESAGIPFLLDDVKREKVQGRRDNARVIIDWVLRSTYRGNLVKTYDKSKTTVDTNAVITGEYMETDRSQSGRLLYMDISGYLNLKEHSDVIRTFQENPKITGYIYGDFIRWFAKKLNCSESLMEWKQFYREKQRQSNPYLKLGDGVRIYENYCMLQLTYYIWKQYIMYCGLENQMFELGMYAVMEKSIDKVIEETAILVDGITSFCISVMGEVIKSSHIRKANFYEQKKSWLDHTSPSWDMREFCLDEEDEFLLIDDVERVWQSISYIGSASPRIVLLMAQDKFQKKLDQAVQKVIENNKMPQGFRGKITLKELADCGIIAYRNETSGRTTRRRYIKDYPEAKIDWNNDKQTVYMEETSAIQFNSFSPCFEGLAEAERYTLEDLEWGCANTIDRGECNTLVKAFVAGKVAQGKD